MRQRIFTILAALSAAAACASPAATPSIYPIALYYSFDSAPSPATVESMKTETARIFDPALVSIEWKPLTAKGGEFESEVVVVRFHGSCSADGWLAINHSAATSGGFALAGSKTSDGHVLPFADVDCGALKRYLAGEQFTDPALALGRAMARVLSHEIYHVLTGSGAHARSGIGRAAHSRQELTAATFAFDSNEIGWLKEWSAHLRVASAAAPAGDGDNRGAAESDAGRR